jgi:hypothetical protein
MYLLASSLAAASIAEQRVSARWGWVGENSGLFEHPASCSDPIRDLVQSCVFWTQNGFSTAC